MTTLTVPKRPPIDLKAFLVTIVESGRSWEVESDSPDLAILIPALSTSAAEALSSVRSAAARLAECGVSTVIQIEWTVFSRAGERAVKKLTRARGAA